MQFGVSGEQGAQALNKIQRARWDMCSSKPHSQRFISFESPPSSIQKEKDKSYIFVFPGVISAHRFRKQVAVKTASAALRGDYTGKV